MNVHRELANAIHRRSLKVARNEAGGELRLATIRKILPDMQVELHDAATVLTVPDDVMLSQWVRWFDLNYQLLVGDVLCLLDMGDGWVAIDVISDRDVDAGIRPSRPPATADGDMRDAQASSEAGLFTLGSVPAGGGTPSVTWNHHIARKLEVFDAAGVRIGWVPIFTTLP